MLSKNNIKLLIEIIHPWRTLIFKLFTLSIIQSAFFSILDPIAFKFLIDAITNGNVKTFIFLGIGVTVISTGGHFIEYWLSLLRKKLNNNIHKEISLNLANSYYLQDSNEVQNNGVGYYLSRIYDEPKKIAESVEIIESIAVSLVILFSSIGVSIWISWKVTLILLIVIPILYYLSNYYGSKLSIINESLHENEARFKSILSSTINSFKTIKIFDLQIVAIKNLKVEIEKPLNSSYQDVKFANAYRSISTVFFSYIELFVIIITGFQVIAGIITLGSLFAIIRSFSLIINSVEQISELIPNLVKINVLLNRYSDFNKPIKSEKKELRVYDKNIVIENLNYSIGEKHIFTDVSFKINHNSYVCISGGNGSGKSTLLSLLVGICNPDKGSIQAPKMENSSASLYPFSILPGSIGHTFDVVSEKYGTNSLKRILIDKFEIASLLDQEYISLSEGQKKKCQIALCLLKPSHIYLFDEPLSNIDDNSKTMVLDTIKENTKGSTVLIVMHEGSDFMSYFDNVLHIENGKIFKNRL